MSLKSGIARIQVRQHHSVLPLSLGLLLCVRPLSLSLLRCVRQLCLALLRGFRQIGVQDVVETTDVFGRLLALYMGKIIGKWTDKIKSYLFQPLRHWGALLQLRRLALTLGIVRLGVGHCFLPGLALLLSLRRLRPLPLAQFRRASEDRRTVK